MSGFAAQVPRKGSDPNEDEPDPDPKAFKGSDPNEDEPDPDPMAAAPEELARICRRIVADDHGDVPACAARLAVGVAVDGTLGDVRGDDGDVFFFVVRELTTVTVETRGTAALRVVLLDRHGHVLSRDGGEASARLVKTLVPGLYFVRLTGEDGSYELLLPREP